MTRDCAEKVHALLLDCAKAIDASVAVVQQDGNEEELRRYRRAAGYLLNALMEDLMKPIYREHEDLIPPQLDRRYLVL
jgi:hypothetical protein